MARGRAFKVDTQPTKTVVVDSLTRDVSVATCIYDLIDNSIDAARNTVLADRPKEEREVLLDSYAGYDVELTLGNVGLKIEDNCGGIAVDHLKSSVMRFGKRSDQHMGIGVFGVGLNRALFKLGKVSHLKTDNGKRRAELILKTEDYLGSKDEDWTLPAEEFATSGRLGTEIDIRQPPADIAQDFANESWVQKFREELGKRYGRFIAKGLSLKVNRVAAKDNEVPIRDDGPYEGEHKYFKTDDGVSVYIEYGQHINHRFTKEKDYDKERNAAITDEYGWTILCNDRAILLQDRSYKTGWDTKFHTEFYGFVGYVSFTGDPAKLPWNTTKTDVDLNNPAYQKALEEMRRFAEQWRTLADKRKREPAPRNVPPRKATKVKRPKVRRARAAASNGKADHNQFRTVLPEDVDEKNCIDKHLRLVHEAKALDLADMSYAGMALIRMLFETSCVTFLDRYGRYGDLVKAAATARKKKIKLSADDEKKLIPTMDEMLSFLTNEPAIFGDAKSRYLKHSLTKMSAHQKALNSAVHNPFQQINRTVAFQIRDEVLPVIRHFIEK